ncbi:MAG: RNA recognition motif domain-containing protein [Bacteroidales bacterium]|jgi:RNA recognition motif-containing protein
MNIYVGNLSFKLQEDDLKEAFDQYGEVTSVKLITDKFTGRSKGFAFVEMANAEDGKRAVQELDGKMLDNRNITVSEAKPKREDSGRY